MKLFGGNPLLSPVSILVVALSLSMGWGIRGNYGHETGAMLPGALAAIAVCVLSGREDWRRRVAYFAFFGALGWAFGGSISYMQVIAYTHSGQQQSQLYGFYGLFAIGFLWAALGGAGTALPAFLSQNRLADLVYSFIPLFVIWCGLYIVEDTPIPRAVQTAVENFTKNPATHADADTAQSPPLDLVAKAGTEPPRMDRHDSPWYCLDSDWATVTIILLGILAFDLVTRRFARFDVLILLAGLGGMLGLGTQFALKRLGYLGWVHDHLVHVQGDVTKFPAYVLLTNWPQVLLDHTEYAGLLVGLIVGVSLYFAIFGEFRYGSRLYLYMAVGWLVGFLALPVLADVHMTPPRGDDWAGIAGVVAFAWLYFLRARWWPALLASIVCGTIGGLGFSGAAWAKLWLLSNGNPALVSDPAIVDAWRHFQHANWHSFLEQTYGFVNGIGVAIALALLVRRVPDRTDDSPRRRSAEAFAVFFVLPVLTYVNMVKNVNDWTQSYSGHRSLPPIMKMPLVSWIEFNAWTWFTLLFWIVGLGLTLALLIHPRRRSAILPESWLGRGELLYFVLLWVFVVGNFGKALAGFNEQRLLTEGVILVNAVFATVLLLWKAAGDDPASIVEKPRYAWLIPAALILGGVMAYFAPIGQTKHVRHIYGDAFAGHSGKNGKPILRFGPEAEWRIHPNERGSPHQ